MAHAAALLLSLLILFTLSSGLSLGPIQPDPAVPGVDWQITFSRSGKDPQNFRLQFDNGAVPMRVTNETQNPLVVPALVTKYFPTGRTQLLATDQQGRSLASLVFTAVSSSNTTPTTSSSSTATGSGGFTSAPVRPKTNHNHTSIIVAAVLGSLGIFLILVGGFILRSRTRARNARTSQKGLYPFNTEGLARQSDDGAGTRMVGKTLKEQLMAKEWSQRISQPSQTHQGGSSDTFSVVTPDSDSQFKVPISSSDEKPRPTILSWNPRSSRSPSPSTVAERRLRLQEREAESAAQVALLESRSLAASDEFITLSRTEREAERAEMERLRAEIVWLRETQRSDWALGLTNEVPPPYRIE